MPHFRIDGTEYPVQVQKIREKKNLDLIQWLARQPLYPKVYWKEKDSDRAHAAVGKLLFFPHIPHLDPANTFPFRLYGGMNFKIGERHDSCWQDFPQTSFWLPQIEAIQKGGKTQIHFYSQNQIFPELVETEEENRDFPRMVEAAHVPEFSLWQNNVTDILEKIAANKLEKLVVARKTTLSFSHPLSPWPLLRHLQEFAKQATIFAYQLTPNRCFLGATPEKFFQKRGNIVEAEAIAGTRPRGKTKEEDHLLEQELLKSPKERREFRYVCDFLENALRPLSASFEWKWQSPQVLKTAHVQHLYNGLLAMINADISVAALLHTLHPTPALGGFPRKEALSFLSQVESFDRGWYGAPIGVLSPQEASFYAAIRSGLIDDNALHLYAGTGIVSGSKAAEEWQELAHKTRLMTEFFAT